MSRSSAVALIVAALAVGLIIGLLGGRSYSDSESKNNLSSRRQPESEARLAAPPGIEGLNSELKQEVHHLRQRVQELEQQLVERSKGNARDSAASDPRSFAKRLFEEYLEVYTSEIPEPETVRRLMTDILKLDDTTAGVFIEQFHEVRRKEGAEKEREVLVDLALASGGTDAAEFINVLLNDPTLDSDLRASLLSKLSGTSGAFFSIKRLPVNASLAATAMRLTRADSDGERRGGAGLLGGVNTEAARIELRRLVTEDPGSGVRTSAVLSLGNVGDIATADFLKSILESNDKALQGEGGDRVRSAVLMALKSLEARYR